MVQKGFGILRTWRTLEIVILTLIIYIPDALSLWFLVKAVGLSLGFADTLVLVGLASLSTLVPSGPTFLGTLQFAYALAIEFAGGSRAVGIAAATLAQLWLLLPIALVATGLLDHGPGQPLSSMLKKRALTSKPLGQKPTKLRDREPSMKYNSADSDITPLLSVIIPAYNEAQTIGPILEQVARGIPEIPKQIVIVDDCSKDGTSEWLRRNLAHADGVWRAISLDDGGELDLSGDGPQNQGGFSFTILFHEQNRGKGAALRTGFSCASGDVIVIQDADLEYNPDDWSRMLLLIVDRKVADVVYGSRFYGRPSLTLFSSLARKSIDFIFVQSALRPDVVGYRSLLQNVYERGFPRAQAHFRRFRLRDRNQCRNRARTTMADL
jgi:hypothetical protein